MRTQTKLLSLVITLLILTILAAPVSAQDMSAQDMMPVQFIIRDENNQPLNDVTVYIYSTTGSMPPTPGQLYVKITIDSGDYWTLGYGKYLCKPTKAGYVSRFPTEDNRISEGQTVCYLYMDRESSEPGQPVTLQAIDGKTQSLLPGVYFKIYYCDPETFEQGDLVKTTSVTTTGEIVVEGLPRGHYCFEAVKDGYRPRYPASEWRFQTVTDPPSSVACIMDPALPTRVIISDGYLYEYIDTSKSGKVTWQTQPSTGGKTDSIRFKDITKAQVLDYLVFEIPANCGYWPNGTRIQDGRYNFTYNFNGADRPGVLYLNRKTDSAGKVTSTQFTIYLNDWDIGDLRGRQGIKMPFVFVSGWVVTEERVTTDTNTYLYPLPSYQAGIPNIKVTEFTGIEWKHYIRVTQDVNSYHIDINGFIDGHKYTSEVALKKAAEVYAKFTNPGKAIHRSVLKSEIDLVEIISPSGTEYVYPLSSQPVEFVEFRPYDPNGHTPLNGVQITVYECDPVTFEPGDVVAVFTVDYGDIRYLPRGYYCIEASLNNYEQVYPVSETRVSNVDGPATALIPMEREEVIEPNQPVEFQPFDINANVPLNGVQITVYTCDPATLEPGDIVDTFTVDYGDIRSLPRGHYCIEASLNNYEQVYSISETRFSNVDGPAIALIPMKREGVIEPNQPVEFRPFDINGHIPLNGVQITVYACDPATFEPGGVVDIFTVDYGDIKSLPRGHYCIKASLNNYEQVYSISETRFSNVDGPAVALIPMKREYVGGEDGSVEVKIVDVDTEEPLQNVRVRIYEALPNFQQGRLVKDVTVNSGDYISLPAGRYFAQASKSGYTQYFEVTNTRVTVDPPSPSILYIPMTSRDGVAPGEGSFLDQSIEAIADLFGVSFGVGKLILGMLLALGVGTATAKQLRGGAEEFGFGMLGGVVLGVLIGLLPIWVLVLLVLIVGLWIGKRYMDGGD